jgi:hypothetical protein
MGLVDTKECSAASNLSPARSTHPSLPHALGECPFLNAAGINVDRSGVG